MKRLSAALPLALGLVTGGMSMEAQARKALDLCIATTEIDLEPFKPIGDGTRHAVLDLFTKDFISTDPGVPGMLDGFHFSADGKTFRGRVAKDATWRDGTPLSPREAALSIAKGLKHRASGETIRVVGTEGIGAPGWEKGIYAGVRILDEREFELTFDDSTAVANRVGVIREILSSGELSNRMWPVRFESKSKTPDDGLGDFVGHYQAVKTKAGVFLKIAGEEIQVHLGSGCTDADYTSPALNGTFKNLDSYDSALSPREMALVVLMNPKRKGLDTPERRAALSAWMRGVVGGAKLEKVGVRLSEAHFEKRESGHVPGNEWPSQGALDFPTKSITLLAANKVIATVEEGAAIEKAATASGLKVNWVFRGADLKEVDAVLHPVSLLGERQAWLEKALTIPLMQDLLPLYPQTHSVLKEIRERSAATIPVDDKLLAAFEKAARAEFSVTPLSRYASVVLTRKGLKVAQIYTESGRRRLVAKEGAK